MGRPIILALLCSMAITLMTSVAEEVAVPAAALAAKAKYEKALQELQRDYQSAVALANTEHNKQLQELQTRTKAETQNYSSQLDSLIDDAQKAGDLDSVLALKAEKDSIAKSGDVSTAALPVKGANARKMHLVAVAKIAKEYETGAKRVFDDGKTVALASYQKLAAEALKRFLGDLADVIKSETQAGQIDSAVAVKNYLTKTKGVEIPPEVPALRTAPGAVVKAMGYAGRSPANREKYLTFFGGTKASEAAVQAGLDWLARTQQKDGAWVFDGTSSKDTVAATGMALLPFLASGQKLPAQVSSGVKWLVNSQKPDGSFKGSSGMYSHAIAGIALCECYGMTGDKALKAPAQAAINFIQNAQGPDGSWGYQAKSNGDTSILGWQIQALQSASYVKDLKVDKTVLKKAAEFLDKVASGGLKATYGYSSPGASKTLTPVGQLSRYVIDGWGPQNPSFHAGVEFILKAQLPSEAADFNTYYYYYANRVVHLHGGDEWHKEWNPRMRDLLTKRQQPKTAVATIAGSWDPDKGISGTHWGRLGSTCMSLLILQEYYRFVPETINPASAGGIPDLTAPAVTSDLPAALPTIPPTIEVPGTATDTVTINTVRGEDVIIADSPRIYELYTSSAPNSDVRRELLKIGRVQIVFAAIKGEFERTKDDFTYFKGLEGSIKGKSYLVKSKYATVTKAGEK